MRYLSRARLGAIWRTSLIESWGAEQQVIQRWVTSNAVVFTELILSSRVVGHLEIGPLLQPLTRSLIQTDPIPAPNAPFHSAKPSIPIQKNSPPPAPSPAPWTKIEVASKSSR